MAPGGRQLPLNSAQGGEITNLNGYFFYEPFKDATHEAENRYWKNRQNAYYGSYRHFLRSVYNNDLANQGFYIEPNPKDSISFYEISDNTISAANKKYLIKAESLKIYYYCDEDKKPIPQEELADRYYLFEKTSMIYPTQEPFIVRKNGTSPQLTFVIQGAMQIKNFANSLPENYSPDMED